MIFLKTTIGISRNHSTVVSDISEKKILYIYREMVELQKDDNKEVVLEAMVRTLIWMQG